MAPKAQFRATALILLLVFPAQLLALAGLPCLHAAEPHGEPLPNCHSTVVDRTGHEQSLALGDVEQTSVPQDCGKCQMQLVFSSMHADAPVSGTLANVAGLDFAEALVRFYHLYPDLLKRPPRTAH